METRKYHLAGYYSPSFPGSSIPQISVLMAKVLVLLQHIGELPENTVGSFSFDTGFVDVPVVHSEVTRHKSSVAKTVLVIISELEDGRYVEIGIGCYSGKLLSDTFHIKHLDEIRTQLNEKRHKVITTWHNSQQQGK